MMAVQDKPGRDDQLLRATLRLNAKLLGLMLGLLLAFGIFVATNWLVLKGGPLDESGHPVVGPHLALLSQYFIGYRVSLLGSLIGAVYGFVVGFFSGAVIAWVYNRLLYFVE